MGFSWTAINIGDEITAAVIAEMRTHLNTLYGDLDLSTWSWVQSLPTQDQIIPSTQYEEYKDVTDNADDQNYCRTHNAAIELTYNVSKDSNLQSAYHLDYDATKYVSVDSSKDGTVQGSNNSSITSGGGGCSSNNSAVEIHDYNNVRIDYTVDNRGN